MKALVYTDTLKMEYCEEPDPNPRPGEAMIRIEAVGICGSDMHAYHGLDERRVPPLILGHEAAGEVLSGTRKGDKVVLNPLMTCGVCDHCQGGRSNLCEKRELIGMRVPGAFAQYIAIPEQNLLDMPQCMNPVKASLTEPTATALHAIRLAEKALHRPLSECRTLILGGGSVGVLAAFLLAHKGCTEIFLGDVNSLRRQTIKALGCCEVYDPLGEALPPSGRFDLVLDAVGSGSTRSSACEFVKPGGVISHIGLEDNEPGLDTRRLTLFEVTFIGNYTYTPVDLRATITALSSGVLGKLDWIEERQLSDGEIAFRDIHNGKASAPKVVLIPN